MWPVCITGMDRGISKNKRVCLADMLCAIACKLESFSFCFFASGMSGFSIQEKNQHVFA